MDSIVCNASRSEVIPVLQEKILLPPQQALLLCLGFSHAINSGIDDLHDVVFVKGDRDIG